MWHILLDIYHYTTVVELDPNQDNDGVRCSGWILPLSNYWVIDNHEWTLLHTFSFFFLNFPTEQCTPNIYKYLDEINHPDTCFDFWRPWLRCPCELSPPFIRKNVKTLNNFFWTFSKGNNWCKIYSLVMALFLVILHMKEQQHVWHLQGRTDNMSSFV